MSAMGPLSSEVEMWLACNTAYRLTLTLQVYTMQVIELDVATNKSCVLFPNSAELTKIRIYVVDMLLSANTLKKRKVPTL